MRTSKQFDLQFRRLLNTGTTKKPDLKPVVISEFGQMAEVVYKWLPEDREDGEPTGIVRLRNPWPAL